jgi:hypothetical protein
MADTIINLTLDNDLLNNIDQIAEKESQTRDELINYSIKMFVNQKQKLQNINTTNTIINKNIDWAKWGDGVAFSVEKDDVVKVSILKKTLQNKCGVEFPYNGVKNSIYKYSFEAWTKFGTREIVVCFGSDKHAPGSVWHPYERINITTKRQTYTLEYKISNNMQTYLLGFNCGGDIGEFFIKIISIEMLTDKK